MELQNILPRKNVQNVTGLSRSQIYNLMAQGKFPPPIPLGGRAVGWIDSEIAEYQKARIEERMIKLVNKLAAMLRGEVDAVALQALVDSARLCDGTSELQLAIIEAGDFLLNGDHDLAQGRLDDVLATLGKAPASVPTAGTAP